MNGTDELLLRAAAAAAAGPSGRLILRRSPRCARLLIGPLPALPPAVHAFVGAIHPAVAVYVSCNPEALARDLRVATAHRYRIESMQPVDMFPHTAHVETVVVLSAL